MVAKYVREIEVPRLTQALDEVKAASKAGDNQSEAASEESAKNEDADDTDDARTQANNARDARAAARADRR